MITEQLIRRSDPAAVQRLLIEQIDAGVDVFRIKPDDGRSWVEFGRAREALSDD